MQPDGSHEKQLPYHIRQALHVNGIHADDEVDPTENVRPTNDVTCVHWAQAYRRLCSAMRSENTSRKGAEAQSILTHLTLRLGVFA